MTPNSGASSLRLVGLVGQRVAADTADLPLEPITATQLSKRVRLAWKAYKAGSFEATYEDERDTNAFAEGAEPAMIRFSGRFRYAGDGNRWRGEYEGVSYRMGDTTLYPRSWSAGFDGRVHYAHLQPQNEFVLGQQHAHEEIPLPEFFWSSHGEGFADSLQKNNWQFQDQQVVGANIVMSWYVKRRTVTTIVATN